VSQDYVEAVKWYRKAAAQGDASSQCCLGICYFYGDGVAMDYTKAAEFFHMASEQGNKTAINWLRSLRSEGKIK
jgi:TPR repeat protein